ncbi:predicted protein, partial [Postia placenta Mad-698-R]
HHLATFGDLGTALKAYVQSYQSHSLAHDPSAINSISDMKRFVEEYPEFRKLGGNVSKHVAIVGELSRVVERDKLLDIGEVEQGLATGSGADLKSVQALITNPVIQPWNKLRLVILYALRYQKTQSHNVASLISLMLENGVQREDARLGGVSALPGGPDQRPGSTQAILETMAQALIVIPPGPLQDAVSEVRKLTRNFHWLQCDEQVEGFLKLCTDVGCAFTRLDRSPGKRLQIDDIIMFLGTNPQFFAYTRIELPEQLVVDENPLYYGGFADVFLARDGTKKLALKKLRISESERHDKRIIRDFSREILCWKFLHHPNINKLVGASLDSFSMLSPWMENGNVPSYIHDTPDVDWIGLQYADVWLTASSW